MRKQLLMAALILPTLALAQDTTKTTETTTATPSTSTTTKKTEKQNADGTSSTVVEHSSKNDASGPSDQKTTKVTVEKDPSGAVTKTKVEDKKVENSK